MSWHFRVFGTLTRRGILASLRLFESVKIRTHASITGLIQQILQTRSSIYSAASDREHRVEPTSQRRVPNFRRDQPGMNGPIQHGLSIYHIHGYRKWENLRLRQRASFYFRLERIRNAALSPLASTSPSLGAGVGRPAQHIQHSPLGKGVACYSRLLDAAPNTLC